LNWGGTYDGHEAPADVNPVTKASVAALAGQGLVATARDKYPRDGTTFSYVASFAEVEVDVETGKYYIVDFLAYADVGSVIHPRALGGQILGRSILGIGHALGQKWVFDPHYGVMLSTRFYQNKPPTILDVPVDMRWGGAGHSRSGNACRCSRHRGAARRRRVRLHLERPLGRTGRRHLPPRAREPRHHSDVSASWAAHAASLDGPHLMEIGKHGGNPRRDASFRAVSAEFRR